MPPCPLGYGVDLTTYSREDTVATKRVDELEIFGNVIEQTHGDVLKGLLLRMLNAVMESDAARLCGAEHGERTDERLNSRNGYRERTLESRMGTLDLAIPKLRRGSYLPGFIEPRRRWERAFVNVVAEAYVLGVSTRKVEGLVESMGAHGMSKSEVSRMAAELDQEVARFRSRPLEGTYPYVWLDALYIKVHEGPRVVSKAALVAYGVNDAGVREVLGVDVADGEMEDAWRGFLARLVERGLRGVQLVISDAHTGLRAARRSVLNGVAWQRCRVHFMRNVLSRVPKAAQGMVSAMLQQVFAAEDVAKAREALTKALEVLDKRYPAAATVVREAEGDVLTYKTFPPQHWRQIHSTNPLERLNREIRRRTDVVGIFPNAAGAARLIGSLLIEQNSEWAVGRRYFSLESMAALNKDKEVAPAGQLGEG